LAVTMHAHPGTTSYYLASVFAGSEGCSRNHHKGTRIAAMLYCVGGGGVVSVKRR